MNIATSIWDIPGNVETLTILWAEHKTAAEIAAALGQGATRASVLGKVHRLHLVDHGKTVTVAKKAEHGNKGQPKAKGIVARRSARDRAEEARQNATLAAREHVPFRAGSMPDMGGVDVTGLIAFADRRIGRDCAWIPGDPADGAMCCGKPVKEGTQWCSEHHARVYPERRA